MQRPGKVVVPCLKGVGGRLNGPKARVKGDELEQSARVVEGLTVSASAIYIDAKVRHYQGIVGSVANEVGLCDPIRGDFSGARLPFSPKWQSSLSADYSLPLGGVNLPWARRSNHKAKRCAFLPSPTRHRIPTRRMAAPSFTRGLAWKRWTDRKCMGWGNRVAGRGKNCG